MSVVITNGRNLLSYLFEGTGYSLPATYYIGLATASPTSAGLFTNEVAVGSYARVAVPNNSANWTVSGTLSQAINDNAVTFVESTASWGTITYVFIADSLTGGTMLYYGALSTTRAVPIATTVYFPAGGLTLQVA